MIELTNVSKLYRKGSEIFTALKDVSFKAAKGDLCVVIGASGAGKSTLLYVIGGMIRPDAGTVVYSGNEIYQLSNREKSLYRKNHIGFMFQQFHLMPYLTVTGNIRLACRNRNHLERIDYYLAKCSLSTVRNKYPSELSVGEKQRTAFIRAIISKPDLLLADEPTGNLDPGNSEALLSLVREYNKDGGTVIIVSHDRGIAKYANRIVSLVNGRMN